MSRKRSGPQYPETSIKGHHRASKTGSIRKHILIAEKALGKPLDGKHPVHHFDENKQNNANGNLVICEDESYHRLLHRRMRALLACGNPDFNKCLYCGNWDDVSRLHIRMRNGKIWGSIYHEFCRAATSRFKSSLKPQVKPRRRLFLRVVGL